MKRFHTSIGFIFLAWVLSCTKVSDEEPSKIPFEKQTGPLPSLNVAVDSVNLSQTIRFDTIAQGGNFSIQFTKLTHGKIKIVEEGKAVQIQMDTGSWEKDSTEYTICKNKVCREGLLKIVNRNYRPKGPDTTDPIPTPCIIINNWTIYVPAFSSPVQIRVPGIVLGDSLKADRYSISRTSDSSLSYIANPIPDDQLWAWDTIRLRFSSLSGQCYRAKIAIVIGDTCEPEARNDVFDIGAATFTMWPAGELVANDKGCNNQIGSYQTRTPYQANPLADWDYGDNKRMNTRYGILVDSFYNGGPNYAYIRTKPGGTEDGFYYYFKNLLTGRVTTAWVRIKF